MGRSIFEEAIKIMLGYPLIRSINNTLITFIPKIPNLVTVVDFHPISLCSMVYKIINKVLADMINYFMPELISDNQTSFVLGKCISDKIIIV